MPKPLETAPSAANSNQGPLLHYELTPIEDLKPAARNARKHSKKQIANLARSMAEFGVVSPVVRDSDNRIVAGHGRVEAAKKLGYRVFPTLLIDHLTPAQLRLFALADNAIHDQSTFDEKARAEEFRDLSIEVPDLDLTLSGYEIPLIEFAIAGLEQTDWSDLDNTPEQLPLVTTSRAGDIYDFTGGHTLVCGDCTNPDVVATAMRGETINLVATDAPYNRPARDYSGKGRFKHADFQFAAGEMSTEQFRTFLVSSFMAAVPHLVDGALI